MNSAGLNSVSLKDRIRATLSCMSYLWSNSMFSSENKIDWRNSEAICEHIMWSRDIKTNSVVPNLSVLQDGLNKHLCKYLIHDKILCKLVNFRSKQFYKCWHKKNKFMKGSHLCQIIQPSADASQEVVSVHHTLWAKLSHQMTHSKA